MFSFFPWKVGIKYFIDQQIIESNSCLSHSWLIVTFNHRPRSGAKCWWRHGAGCHHHGWTDTGQWCCVFGEEHCQSCDTSPGSDGKGCLKYLKIFKRNRRRPLRFTEIWIFFSFKSVFLMLSVQRREQDYPFTFSILLFLTHWKSQTAHMMLTSRGANLFAESIGMVTVPTDTLVTEYERKEWEKQKTYMKGVWEHFNSQWWASAAFDFILTPPVLDLNFDNQIK